MKNTGTKLVEVQLSARTRVEYTEVVEVPIDISPAEMNELMDKRYANVDGGEYTADPEYWERSVCTVTPTDMPNAAPSMMAFRTAHGLHIERADASSSVSGQLSAALYASLPDGVRGGLAAEYSLGTVFTVRNMGTIVNLWEEWLLVIALTDGSELSLVLPSENNDGYREMIACYGTIDKAVEAMLQCRIEVVCTSRVNGMSTAFDVLPQLLRLDFTAAKALFTPTGSLDALKSSLPAEIKPEEVRLDVSECELANLVSLLGGQGQSIECRLSALQESVWDDFVLAAMRLRIAKGLPL